MSVRLYVVCDIIQWYVTLILIQIFCCCCCVFLLSMMAKWNGIFQTQQRQQQHQHSKEKSNYLYMMSLALAPAPKNWMNIFHGLLRTTYDTQIVACKLRQLWKIVEWLRICAINSLQQWMQWMRFDISTCSSIHSYAHTRTREKQKIYSIFFLEFHCLWRFSAYAKRAATATTAVGFKRNE